MAILRSEDTDSISSLEIRRYPAESAAEEHPGQIWEQCQLVLTSGARQISEVCMLCRKPQDEISSLIDKLADLLEGSRKTIIFEPSEPSFELTLSQATEGGIKAEIWIDSGNASTGFYRWDAAGIRFFTTRDHLTQFKRSLEIDWPRV